LRDCESIYLSLDMDYFDPSVAPGVSNPEPGGKTFKDFLELLNVLRRFRLVGADVVELSPPYDRDGVTAVLAARAVVEIATSFWSPPRALQGPCC
jgi:agmatinase